MEIIDNRSKNVDGNIKIGDILEVINSEDRSREYWIVGYSGVDEENEKDGRYLLINLETGVSLPSKDLVTDFRYYFTGCDIRVVDTELHIVE